LLDNETNLSTVIYVYFSWYSFLLIFFAYRIILFVERKYLRGRFRFVFTSKNKWDVIRVLLVVLVVDISKDAVLRNLGMVYLLFCF
jgi:hypothetical protein